MYKSIIIAVPVVGLPPFRMVGFPNRHVYKSIIIAVPVVGFPPLEW